MSKILLDTSTLIEINNSNSIDIDNLTCPDFVKNNIFTGIEALILYDDIFIDGSPYVNHYKIESSILRDFSDILKPIKISEDELLNIHKKYKCYPVEKIIKNFRKDYHKSTRMNKDYLSRDCSSAHMKMYSLFFEKEITDKYIINLEKDLFPILVNTIRCAYYIELQNKISSDLVLHPNKKELLSSMHKLTQEGVPFRLIRSFESALHERTKELHDIYLGDTIASFSVPIIASYVLNRARKEKESLSHVIRDVRNSKKAVQFREGMSCLIEACRQGKTALKLDILQNLDEAKHEWEKHIHHKPYRKTRKINLSVSCFAGIGTDIAVPSLDCKKCPSEKLLTFIHDMMLLQ
ncbi:hypothetical protein [Akkermansia glycaniphila]|uniref:Uncharacterized protein n=1 Tax=Akkermansia glycaniphila TaxID=1679444 RepID=A0A1H6M8I3_9BACT|nr:hypothetical protein [Akkermansia glycaniphila]SEH97708.1 Hypothetical protein PYTT_2236 [Akkermansia glycaniphila]